MPVSERTFEQVVREDPDGRWELHCGLLVRKPAMTFDHNRIAVWLAHLLLGQLDRSMFDVRTNAGHVYYSAEQYYVPDVYVIPLALAEGLRGRPDRLEMYREPLPLVVEVWSPSTGDYDVDKKLPEYRRHGDPEIWRIHPYDRALTAWVRQADGSYTETVYRHGVVRPAALAGVAIDLDGLWET
jgi:Uma2 family endonuclease